MSSYLSEPFRTSALAERQELVELYEAARQRHEEFLFKAERAALEADRLLRTIRELGELLGVENQLSITGLSEELRGERLREVAARVAFEHFRAGEQFHYRRWFSLVTEEGYRIGGKNPAATFLTQVARIDGVVRVGRRTGLYEIDSTSPRAA